MAKKTGISSKGVKAPMPHKIAPMLCTLTREPVPDAEYLYEIKWDGYRIISFINKKGVHMYSRSGLDYTRKYPPIAAALSKLKHDVILDGEIVVFNNEGLPDFDALQLYNGHNTPISYCVFDILWSDGYDLKDLPLTERKSILKKLVGNNQVIKFSESFDDGPALYEMALKKNLEGIVAKRRNSLYRPGTRGYDWLKTPTRKRQEFVIGGWAESEKARAFRSLLFGAYENEELVWIGRSGGGYREKDMPEILRQLKSLEIKSSPFSNKVLDTKGAVIHWIKPQLVANFEFATWTKSGRIRKPATFLGFRKDKKPKQVVREIAVPLKDTSAAILNNTRVSESPTTTSPNSNWPEVEKQSRSDLSTLDINGCTIDLYDVDRVIWKGIDKAALIKYYHKISSAILPHVRDRPQSLHIKLHGANAPGLYIKDMEGRQPECADIFTDQRRHKAQGKRTRIDYLICNNEATLLWMINLGCIDINPWNSRVQDHLHPDYLVIDLDPSEKTRTEKGLEHLRQTAMAVVHYCLEKKLKIFVKTSGKTGLHVLVPCSGLTYVNARLISELICSEIHALVPDISTTENTIANRNGKIYIDPSQNDYADTIAAPYCLRPYILPTVSTPLELKEIGPKLDPHDYDIHTIEKRLIKKGELFADILDEKIRSANNKILRRI